MRVGYETGPANVDGFIGGSGLARTAPANPSCAIGTHSFVFALLLGLLHPAGLNSFLQSFRPKTEDPRLIAGDQERGRRAIFGRLQDPLPPSNPKPPRPRRPNTPKHGGHLRALVHTQHEHVHEQDYTQARTRPHMHMMGFRCCHRNLALPRKGLGCRAASDGQW